MGPADQIDRFLHGLRPHIANEVDMHDPKTLEEAMNLAQRAEIRRSNYQRPFQQRFINQQQGNPFSSYSNRFNSNSSSNNGATPMELGNTEVVEQNDVRNNLDQEWEQAKLNYIYDGKKNVTFKRRGPELSKEEYDQLSKEGKCFKCRRKGHMARNCSVNNQSKN
jgi:hypothetical protein